MSVSKRKQSYDISELMDVKIIEFVKEHPSLYYTKTSTDLDEKYWDDIENETGVQKCWLKKRWSSLRDLHRGIALYNHTHKNKVPPHPMANRLSFLVINLNEANSMDFHDVAQMRSESFHITEERLKKCDINESVTIDSIKVPKVPNKKKAGEANPKLDSPDRPSTTKTSLLKSHEKHSPIQIRTKTPPTESPKVMATVVEERSEDTIFGELVVAMLKKMTPEQKKQAKKEIMNILL